MTFKDFKKFWGILKNLILLQSPRVQNQWSTPSKIKDSAVRTIFKAVWASLS